VSGKHKVRWLYASGERRSHSRQQGFPQQIEFLQAPKNLFQSRTRLGRQIRFSKPPKHFSMPTCEHLWDIF
jgi:hypothetical protein